MTMIDQNMIEHYKQVLKDLERQREELDRTIENIRKLIGIEAYTVGHSNSPTVSQSLESLEARYPFISVRWAILGMLSQVDFGPMTTGEITQKLLAAGVPKTGTRFSSNVSAVLSTMSRKPEPEVESVDGGWKITAHGRVVWEGVRVSPKYQNAIPATVSHVTISR